MNSLHFLPNPPSIRKAIHQIQESNSLDLAVAFIGADWAELLSDFQGKLRLICWLSSTNTNPFAVAQLIKRPGTQVKQRNGMHCKVYIAPTKAVVVGSANLSKAALSEDETAGQDEAAVLITTPRFVKTTSEWFKKLWSEPSTRNISKADFKKAKVAWQSAQAHKPRHGGGAMGVKRLVHSLPGKPSRGLKKWADAVRGTNVKADMTNWYSFFRLIDPSRLGEKQRADVGKYLISWTGHPGAYQTFLTSPIREVRKGLSLLFDESLDLEARLVEVQSLDLLRGLRLPSLSTLLQWRNPERYVPYNYRTKVFLKKYKLQAPGMSAASPACYVHWLEWANRLAQDLELPTPGHVDRMVEYYYESISR